MANYFTIGERFQTEFVEKRSRFIGTIIPVQNESEAQAVLEEFRTKYWDATHNCFAYVTEKGRLSRFSDDGEPHGTAGKPILDVINGSSLVNVIVVVTRYFGGVLLGTGGLVHAYSKSARDVVSAAQIIEMVECAVYNIVCEYTDHAKLVKLLQDCGASIEETEFTDKVTITYALRTPDVENFENKLTETFSARIKSNEKEIKLVPFPVKKEN